MESFPELYRDAIMITRKLGIRYLWIDSLCILQDCKDDWLKEAAKMGDIYRYSFLTLSALSSLNCHHGMLGRRDGVAPMGTQISNNANSLEKSREQVFRAAPLCQRAWALQERILSPRLLYYSEGEMFWECLVHTAREGNYRVVPRKGAPYRYDSFEFPQVRYQLITPLDENPSFPVSPPSDWQIIVSEYSRCRLTYRSDKLPALSGLATMYQRNTGYTYASGIWIENLVYELLWFCPIEQNYQHQSLEAASGILPEPSWSWISTDLAVRFKTLGNMLKPSTTDFEFIQVDEADLATSDDVPSVLTIKAHFYRITIQAQSGSRTCCILDSSGVENLGSGILDAIEEHPHSPPSYAAVLIRRKLARDPFYEVFDVTRHMTYFVIVVPALHGTGEERWRRIGLGWTAQDMPFTPEVSLIRLV
jgi:hypothetical protein